MRAAAATETIAYYEGKTLADPQPGCEVLRLGDRVVSQLLDPYDLPPLRTPPQRVAYERVIAGDPAALALLKDRIVLVGTLLPGRDRHAAALAGRRPLGRRAVRGADRCDGRADVTIRPIDPIAEWALISGLALLGAVLRPPPARAAAGLRFAALTAIASSGWPRRSLWYRTQRQLIGVPYDLAALALGAWLANRSWRRTPG